MAVVVNLDPLRRAFQVEQFGHTLEQVALRRILGGPARQRIAGIGERVIDELALGAAHRPAQVDPPPGLEAQRLGKQRVFGRAGAQQDAARRRLVAVELAHECRKKLRRVVMAATGREVGAVAEILPGAEEKHLYAGLPAVEMGGDHVGVADALHINVLMRLNAGQRPDAVAVNRRRLELQRVARGLHAFGKRLLDGLALAREEGARLRDGRLIVLR